jgi:hypothetical protein
MTPGKRITSYQVTPTAHYYPLTGHVTPVEATNRWGEAHMGSGSRNHKGTASNPPAHPHADNRENQDFFAGFGIVVSHR